MTSNVADAFASRFIARTDVLARQFQGNPGGYVPERRNWTRADLEAHLSGTMSYGHYLINPDDKCKLFAFDIDLEQSGFVPSEFDEFGNWNSDAPPREVSDLRAMWHDRSSPARKFFKVQFRTLSAILAARIHSLLGVDTCVAYSGNKGLHVYGLTGMIDADQAHDAAQIVLDDAGLVPARGKVFYKYPNSGAPDSWESTFQNLSVELFPKQGSLSGKDLGNLMRLPLGRNLKNPDPTFFLDMTKSLAEMVPIDPLIALEKGRNPWST